MTDLITAEEAIAALKAEILDHGFHEEGQLMRLTGIIAAELAACKEREAVMDYVLQEPIHNRLVPRVVDIAYSAFMNAKRPNTEDGAAELAKLRGERDALLDAVQANMLRPDYLRAERAEAERDRLAAELAAANAREAGLRNFVEDFAAAKIDALRFPRPLSPEDELDPVVEAEEVWAWQADARAALVKPGTEGGE